MLSLPDLIVVLFQTDAAFVAPLFLCHKLKNYLVIVLMFLPLCGIVLQFRIYIFISCFLLYNKDVQKPYIEIQARLISGKKSQWNSIVQHWFTFPVMLKKCVCGVVLTCSP